MHIHFRDGSLFFIGGGGGGGVTIFETCRQFFQRVMYFKQLFSLHFVMETILLQPVLKNITGFFIDLI